MSGEFRNIDPIYEVKPENPGRHKRFGSQISLKKKKKKFESFSDQFLKKILFVVNL
jgi:hypothetical protein